MAGIPEFFGLDLGNNSIKVAQLKAHGSKYELTNYASVDINANLLENQSEAGIKELGDKIKQAVKDAKIDTEKCVMSLPESSIFSRLVTLPKVTEAEQDEAVHWAIKSLVPVPLENLNVSYIKIDEFSKDGKEMVNWYVVAARKELVEQSEKIIKAAGFSLLAVETEALATTRTIFSNYSVTGDAIILDFGADATNLIISRNSAVMFSQTINTGSNSLTKVLAADFGLDDIQAEKYKYTFGLDETAGEGKIARSIKPLVDVIISELSRTISYYKDRIGGSNLSKIYLTGGGSKLPKFAEYVKANVQVEVELSTVLGNIEVKKDPQNFDYASFNVAIGLGLKGLLDRPNG
jgi:type IV pilus assembly protein PilM